MKTLKILCSLFLFMALVSCQRESQLTDSQRDEIIDGVKKMAIQFFVDSDAKNIDAVLNHLDNSKKFFWVFPPDPTHISRDDLASALKAEIETDNSVKSTWDNIQIEPLTANLAYYQGSFRQVVTEPSGDVSEFFGIESAVIILREDGWKFLNGQTYFAPVQSE